MENTAQCRGQGFMSTPPRTLIVFPLAGFDSSHVTYLPHPVTFPPFLTTLNLPKCAPGSESPLPHVRYICSTRNPSCSSGFRTVTYPNIGNSTNYVQHRLHNIKAIQDHLNSQNVLYLFGLFGIIIVYNLAASHHIIQIGLWF